MPTQPCVMRPRRSPSVISRNTRPAPEFASIPRCVMCQSPMTPSVAEYWHIGATLMRLASSRPLILYGENSALVMRVSDWKGVAWRDAWRNGEPWRSSQPGNRQRERLCARHQRIHHHEFLRRVRLAADRADCANGGSPDAGREAGVGAAARELTFHFQGKIVRACGV